MLNTPNFLNQIHLFTSRNINNHYIAIIYEENTYISIYGEIRF